MAEAPAGANASAPPFKIHVVSSSASPEFGLFIESIRSARVAALDAEWKPFSRRRSASPDSAQGSGFSNPFPTVALLQIAFLGEGEPSSRALVFLVDLLAVPLQELHGPLKELFESPQVLKLGFVFQQDLDYLNATFAAALECKDFAFDKVEPFEDISDIYSCFEHLSSDTAPSKQPKKGLATICMELLNISMSKEKQCSDWSFRPLSDEQKTYAAADAYYLLEIHAICQERIGNDDEPTSSGGNYLQEGKMAASMANFSRKIVPKKLEEKPVSSKRNLGLCKEWEGPAPWDPLVGGDGCPKFLCDMMVEGLAKHLRFVGFDASTSQSKKRDPSELIDLAQKEKRVLLTKHAKLLKYENLPRNQVYIVKSSLKADQLPEVNETFQLKITQEQLKLRPPKGGKSKKKKVAKKSNKDAEATKKSNKDAECTYCHKKGHLKRRCRKYKADKAVAKVKETEAKNSGGT